MKVRIVYLVITVFLGFRILPCLCQSDMLKPENFSPGTTKSDIPLFTDDKLLEITIITDLRTLTLDTEEERGRHQAKLSYVVDSDTIIVEAQAETRGNFRRDRSICTFPPLRILFDSVNTVNTIFSGIKRVKMVTHCQNRKLNEDYLLQEYLMYRTYNIITDLSYRVRLARIKYIDTEERIKEINRFAFFIEPIDKVAERNGAREIELKGLPLNHINHPLFHMFTVFQYLIGNTDWSVRVLHNVKLLSFSSEPMAIPIPYDFDFSGVINAYYAAPDPNLNISSVRERLFRSECRTIDELASTFDLFRERKEEIYSLYSGFSFLDEKLIGRILSYYDKFYETLDDPKKAKREFVRCNTRKK